MRLLSSIQRKSATLLRQWKYELVGPTTAHLRYEFCLLVSLLILTVGSLRGLYKDSFGTKGDFVYLLLTGIVAGRHLLFRLLCTWDPSTHASPSLTGLVSHFLQSHCTGGQTFDRPASLQRQWLHRECHGASSSTAPPAAADRLLAITAVSDATVGNTEVSWLDLLPSTVFYAWQIVRVDFLYPLSCLFSSKRPYNTKRSAHKRTSFSKRNSNPKSGFRVTLEAIQEAAFHLFIQYGPSLQFCIGLGVFLYYKWHIYEYRTGKSPMSLFYSPETLAYRETTVLSVSTQNTNAIRQAAGKNGDRGAGIYDRMVEPTERDVLFVMLSFGTLFCLFVFSRIVPPLPDLVAGGNVIKDVRNEARAAALENSAAAAANSGSGGGGGGGSNKKGSRHSRNWLLAWPIAAFKYVMETFVETSPTTAAASEAAPWTERQRSIVSENRLHMAVAVIIVRVLENVVLFGILPRTHFACRASGHCPAGPPLWELARVLYPGGHTQPRRLDGWNLFHFMERDPASMTWSFLGVVIISLILLVAQMVVLNKSYLSTMAYISGEWALIDSRKNSKRSLSSAALQQLSSTGSEPTVWDPKRKYKKGELVCYPHASDAIYQATSNSPEGKPRDRELYGMNELLKKELGHPSTSSYLSDLAAIQFMVILAHMLVWLVLVVIGHSYTTYGMFYGILAHIVASQGLVSLARPSSNMSELRQLHAEVVAGKKRQ